MKEKKPICLFDSGIGGFTVLKYLLKCFPSETYIYLANLADMPFGDKTQDEIVKIANKNITWLSSFNPQVILMACNTSSSLLTINNEQSINERQSHQHLLSNVKCPIHGIIKPIAKEIANSTYKKITVWATSRTIDSNAYKDEINKLNPKIEVEQIACPKLVPIIEDLSSTNEEKELALSEYLSLISHDSEALIWGCTHYPLLENHFFKLSKLKTINPAMALIKQLTLGIEQSHMITSESNVRIYTTAQKEKVEQFAKIYLGGDFEIKEMTFPKQEATYIDQKN